MSDDIVVVDSEERVIKVGSYISDPTDPEGHGVVTLITDPDGDADDEGRAIAINPYVHVKYKDGSEEEFITSYSGAWYTPDIKWDYQCEDLEVQYMGNELLKFIYVNWNGEEHEYVIEPESLEYKEVSWSSNKTGQYSGFHHVVNGMVVTRDGDPRPEMGNNRRRTFIIAKMQVIKELDRSK